MTLIKVSRLSQEDTSELNEEFIHETADSNRDYNNKRQLENQILYARKLPHQKYEESRLQDGNLNSSLPIVSHLQTILPQT